MKIFHTILAPNFRLGSTVPCMGETNGINKAVSDRTGQTEPACLHRIVQRFNGRFRDECLNEHWFTSPSRAKVVIEAWRREYNEERPKKSLGGLTPTTYARKLAEKAVTPPRTLKPKLLKTGGRRAAPLGDHVECALHTLIDPPTLHRDAGARVSDCTPTVLVTGCNFELPVSAVEDTRSTNVLIANIC